MEIAIKFIPREIDLRWHTNTKRFTLISSFNVLVHHRAKLLGGKAKVRLYTVPKGFDTDLASIPRLFLSTTGGKLGKHLVAAVLHDFQYRTGEVRREVADAIFLASMEELGVWYGRRQILYRAVRLGGASSYTKSPNPQKT